jgi:hypothetical protein
MRSIHEENSPPQAARVAVNRPSSWQIESNKKTGDPAFGYPAKDQRKLAAESPFMSMLVPNKHPLRKLVPAQK